MTKDSNPIIRTQCVLGLSKIGATSIRTLALGLLDSSNLVRENVEKVLEKMHIKTIIEEFEDKSTKKLSLKIALKDILDKNIYIKNPIKRLFKTLISYFDEEV